MERIQCLYRNAVPYPLCINSRAQSAGAGDVRAGGADSHRWPGAHTYMGLSRRFDLPVRSRERMTFEDE